MKKLIIGHVGHGQAQSTLKVLEGIKEMGAIVITEPKTPDLIINGVGYNKIEDMHKQVRQSRMGSMLMAMASLSEYGVKPKNDILSGINFIEEFKLIQEKKSKQPRAVRDAVVYRFNQNYKVVPQVNQPL